MGLPGPTGPNTVPQGSLAAPSINFEGDTGTGIFSPGAGQIALAQANVSCMASTSARRSDGTRWR